MKNFVQTGRVLPVLLPLLLAAPAHGQLLTNLSIGNPKGLALANAVTADPPGIDSIHFNPAGLAKIQGRQTNLKVLIAQVDLESHFGEPIRPNEVEKQAYYNVNEQCQTDYPAGDADAISQCWGIDPVAGASTQSGDPVVMIPFVGVQEVPILAFPMGGIAFEDAENRWVLGSAVYVPEGIGLTREMDGPGAYQGQEVALTRLTYFSPTIGLPLADNLFVGLGLNLSYQGLYVRTKFRAPTLTLGYLRDLNNIAGSPLPPIEFGPYDSAGLLSLELEDMLSVGFNFGLLWEPLPWLALGFVYHSESKSDLSGDFKMENSELFLKTTTGLSQDPLVSGLIIGLGGAPLNAQAVEEGSVELEYITPQNLAFGASIRVLPDLKLNVDAKWSNYSRWNDLTFYFDQNVDFLSFGTAISTAAGYNFTSPDTMVITREYEDTWSWALGLEYQINANWVARVGYEPRTSAIPDDRTDLIFPLGKMDLYAAGLGWQFDKATRVDAAIAFIHSETSTPACESQNANSCEEGNVVYNPYFATDFENEVNGVLVALSVDRKF
ncbi:MAG: hypothetical protein HPY82_01770 [Gammaproteobacteria bacterium]|nr:hypothetical protein [Gammaproteobacteria bacterium]